MEAVRLVTLVPNAIFDWAPLAGAPRVLRRVVWTILGHVSQCVIAISEALLKGCERLDG